VVSRVSKKRYLNCLLLMHRPNISSFFPENSGKLGSQDEVGGGRWEVQTVQSVQWKRHPVTGFSGSLSERILREEHLGHVKLMYVLNEGEIHYNFAQIFYTELWISKKCAFYFWSSVARCVIAPPPPKFYYPTELTVIDVFIALIDSNIVLMGGIMALLHAFGGTFG
jgi:hypothetical protein